MRLTVWTVDRLCSQVNLRLKRPIVDLSAVTFLSPFALVYLGMFLRYHNAKGKTFKVAAPRSKKARRYLQRQKFVERFNVGAEVIKQGPLHQLAPSTSLNDIVDLEDGDRVADSVTDAVVDLLRDNKVDIDTGLFADIASELVDNFAQHADQPLAALAMQCYPNFRRVVMAVGDCGVGARANLASKPEYAYLRLRPHTTAILKALQPQVSSKWEGGMGLTDVSEGVQQANGRLIITSGNGRVVVDHLGTRLGVTSHNLSGVQVEISIPERNR